VVRHPPRPARLVRRGQRPGLEFAAQPVHVGQDLPAQRPALRALGRIGGQHVGQPVLPARGLLQMILEHHRQRGVSGDGLGRLGVGLDELAVSAHAGGQFGDDRGQPGPGLRVLDRAVRTVQPRAVQDRAGQHAQVRGGPLQRVDAVAQARGRVGVVGVAEPARVQPDALLGLAQRLVHPLDLTAQRPGTAQPFGRAAQVGLGGQPVGHLAEQVAHLAAQVADRVLCGLDSQRREEQAGGQPGRRSDQGLGDAAGRGRVRVDREDQHGADRHLQRLLAEPQRHAERQRARDEQAEYPPAERDVRRHRHRGEHAGGDADDALHGAADGVEQRRLYHQERGQRGEHGPHRTARQLQGEQVGEHRRQGHPGDVDRGRLGATADQGELLSLAPGDRLGGLAHALAAYGTNRETFHGISTESRSGWRDTIWL
jgi:hypothetical protein